MATRTIVTSQPDVACDVCERRLLRGEQPDAFITHGRRMIVCEVCAPRAANEGWTRESDMAGVSMPELRPRRGRSLFERLPSPFRPRPTGSRPTGGRPTGRAYNAGSSAAPRERYTTVMSDPLVAFDFLDDGSVELAPGEPPSGTEEPFAGDGGAALAEGSAPADTHAVEHPSAPAAHELGHAAEGHAHAEPPAYLQEALDAFNASEFPRRVAGVARSLGPPEVNVRSAEHLSSVVRIVVAWELCWYRYEVDVSEPPAHTSVLEQGSELAQLEREERVANAVADESGALALAL